LRAVDVTMRFGGAVAVDHVSLELRAGEIAGMIGPNGAGKSTLFDIFAGDRRPTEGQVLLHGEPVETRAAHTRLALGLGRSFQIPRPFADMTLVENVMLGAQRHAGERVLPNLWAPRSVARTEAAVLARAMQLLDFVALAPLARQPAGVLSGGQRKLLELARLLMAEPSIVLLDEPAAGVHPALLEIIMQRIQSLNAAGITFLIVEHNMALVTRLCARVFVMSAGALLCEGDPAAVVRDPRVIEAYLGAAAA
jgi:branched-chain amino acid transport system ATP-binding protein